LIIPEIIFQHAEETAFLWGFRDRAVHKANYSLKNLADIDERVEAHIDGLRIAGEAGWDVCQQALELEEPGEVFAASVLAFEGGDEQRIDTVIVAGSVSPETWRGLVSAFGWLSLEQATALVSKMLQSEILNYKRLAIAGSAIHRLNPGIALTAAFDDPEPIFQARALKAVGELKRSDLLPELRLRFKHDEASCRFWAAWSALLLRDAVALDILKPFAINESAFQQKAVQLFFRVIGSEETQASLTELAKEPNGFRQVVIATGEVGDPVRIPWLIEVMTQPELARVAGEAFSMITGVDIAYENLEGEWPEGFEVGPTENPEDEDVEMDPDEDLPWPNPELIADWWHKNKSNFKTGIRYLVGKPITGEHCQQVLRTGYQRQRAAAALELAIMNPGTPLFNVCAPGFRQQKLLGLK